MTTPSPEAPPPPRRGPVARLTLALAACALATLAYAALAPHVPLPVLYTPWAAYASFGLAFALVTGEVLGVARAGASVSGWRALAGAALLALGVALLGWLAPGWLAPPAERWGASLLVALLLGGGTCAGGFVGNRIQHVGHLGVVAVVSAIADATSVFHESGPTAQILTDAPTLALLALPAPMAGTDHIVPVLGVGDVVMASLYVAAARRHHLSEKRTLLALALGMAATLAVLMILERALPALPFLGAAILMAHPEARLPPVAERRQAVLGLLVVIVLAAWFWLR